MSPQLQSTLKRAHRLSRVTDVAAAGARAVGLLLAAGLVAVLADAIFAFSPALLVSVNILLAAVALAALVMMLRAALRHRYDPRRLARLLEQRLHIADSRLINAVEFTGPSAAGAASGVMSAALAQLAVAHAEEAAGSIPVTQAIDRAPLNRSLRAAGLLLLGAAGLWLAIPGLFNAAVPRYLSPSADLPPFTLVKFDIAVEPARIYYGQPASIRARFSGPTAPQRANVIFETADGRQALPMILTDDTAVLAIQKATQSRRFYIHTPSGRSGWHELTVRPAPLIQDVTLRYHYPAYTRWPATEKKLDEQGVRVLAGTTVGFTVTSNLPLRAGRLVISSESPRPQEITLSPSSDRAEVVYGSVPITASGEFQLDLISGDGVPSEQPLRGVIKVSADEPPQVQMLAPDLRVAAPLAQTIPVTMAAHDDIGVSRVTLSHRINDGPTVTTELPLQHKSPTYATGALTLDLQKLGARPGDIIRGFATAYDNHPTPAHVADSPAFEIAVLSDEEYARLARQQYTLDELAREIEKLAERLEQIDARRDKLIEAMEKLQKKIAEQGGEMTAEDRRQLEQIAREMQAMERESQQLAAEMEERSRQPAAYDFEKAMQKQLAERADKLGQQSRRMSAAREAMQQDPARLGDALKQMKQDAAEAAADEQQRQLTEKQLKQLALAERLAEQAEAIKDIAAAQKEIAERLTPLRDRPNMTAEEKARATQISKEQRQLKQELETAMEALEQAAKEASEELPRMSGGARRLLQAMRELQIPNDQGAAAESAAQFAGTPAFTAAQSAADKLAGLIQQCNSLCSGNSDDLDGCFGLNDSALRNALGQLGQRGGRGSGQGSGSGRGVGSSGIAGGGAATGQSGGAAQQSRLMGPHQRSTRESNQKGARSAGAFSRAGEPDERTGDTAEDLTGAARDTQGAAGSTRGVPLQYRGMAEQYFRRLAEQK